MPLVTFSSNLPFSNSTETVTPVPPNDPTMALIQELAAMRMSPEPSALYDLQVQTGQLVGLNAEHLTAAFGEGRTLGVQETRQLYHSVVHPIATFASKTLCDEKTTDCAAGNKVIAKSSSATRSAARLYSRERGGMLSQAIAERRDAVVYGKGLEKLTGLLFGGDTAPSFENFWKKYSGDAVRILQATSRSNTHVDTIAGLIGSIEELPSLALSTALSIGR